MRPSYWLYLFFVLGVWAGEYLARAHASLLLSGAVGAAIGAASAIVGELLLS